MDEYREWKIPDENGNISSDFFLDRDKNIETAVMHSYHMLGAGRFPLLHLKRFKELTSEEWHELLVEARQEYLDNTTIVDCSRNFQKAQGRSVDIGRCTLANKKQQRDHCFYTCAACGIRDGEMDYSEEKPLFVKDLPKDFIVSKDKVKESNVCINIPVDETGSQKEINLMSLRSWWFDPE